MLPCLAVSPKALLRRATRLTYSPLPASSSRLAALGVLPATTSVLPRASRFVRQHRFFSSSSSSSEAAAASATTAATNGLELGSWPSDIAAKGILQLHEMTGLPWWGTIVATALIMRVSFLPLTVITQRNAANLAWAKTDLEAFRDYTEKNPATNAAQQMEHAQMMQAIYKKHDIKMSRMFLSFAQAPFFISVFLGLQKLAAADVGLKTGGLWFIQDLTVPDSTYMLPILSAVLISATIEIGTADGPPTEMNRRMKMIFRALPPLSIPLTLSFPTAVVSYWVTTNFFSLSQALIFKIPGVKPMLGIRPLPKYLPAPSPMDMAQSSLNQTNVTASKPSAPFPEATVSSSPDEREVRKKRRERMR